MGTQAIQSYQVGVVSIVKFLMYHEILVGIFLFEIY